MPWQQSAPYAGFSTVKPWLKVDDRHYSLAVDQQSNNPDSVLAFCKTLIQARKVDPVLRCGATAVACVDTDILLVLRIYENAFRLVVLNYGAEAKHLNLRQGEVAQFLAAHGVSCVAAAVPLLPQGFALLDR